MNRLLRSSLLLALLAVAPVLAIADDGYVTADVTLRAGPDVSYPAIEIVPSGEPVVIEGCTDGYEWCDVIWGQDRGWIAGNYIQYNYDDQPVPIPQYGAAIGIPIVTFAISDYWGRYYYNRPFYEQRDRWFNQPIPHHAPPPYRGPLHDYAHAPPREPVHQIGHPAMGYPAHPPGAPGGHPEYHSSSGNRAPAPAPGRGESPPQHRDEHHS